MVEVWCWAITLASVVVVAWWRTLAAYCAMWVYGVCDTVAWRHIDSYIHLAWATRLYAINIVCHCTADCHY